MLDVYIGDLDDPSFQWEGGNWNGNTPYRKSSFFPNGHRCFFAVVDKIKAREFDGKQVDWGAWVARLTPDEMISFLDEQCGAESPGTESIREYIKGLDPNKRYALVASEL